MTKYDFAQPNQRFKLMINLSAGLLSTLAVGIFAVTKSVECAWLLGTAFLALGFLLIRPNPQYRAVTSVVEMSRTERPEFAKRVKHESSSSWARPTLPIFKQCDTAMPPC